MNEKIKLIKRNTQEIIGEEELIEKLNSGDELSCYLGTAPTGRPHVGYFVWGMKLADLLNAGFKVKVLLADLHAALDNTPWDVLEERYEYYSKIIPLMIKALGGDISKLEFIRGSDFEMKKEYVYDIFKLSTLTSVHDAHKAASEVVKLGDNPKLSGYIYPIMQALDEEYLGVDMQVGGMDQRKIFVYAREYLPKIGYSKRVELLTPLIPGLIGKKMSASIKASKIDLLDDEKEVKEKLNKADFIEGETDNGIMAFFEHIIFTLKEDKKEKLVIERPEKFGGNLEYEKYKELKKDVKDKKVHPLDVKNSLAKEISNILKIINQEKNVLEEISRKAYPEEN